MKRFQTGGKKQFSAPGKRRGGAGAGGSAPRGGAGRRPPARRGRDEQAPARERFRPGGEARGRDEQKSFRGQRDGRSDARAPRGFGDRAPRGDTRKPRDFADRAPRGEARKSRDFADRAPRGAPLEQGAEVPETERYVFGINPVTELLRANPERLERLFTVKGSLNPRIAGEIFSRASDAGIRVEQVDRERLPRLKPGSVHQGVIAEVLSFDYLELHELIAKAKGGEGAPLYVLLDGLQDPHNFGAIVRSAHALGASGVVVPKDRAAGVTGTVAKASAGAIEHTPIARVTNLSRAIEELQRSGVWVVAADPKGDRTLWEAPLDGPLALVIGAEGQGVREGVLKACDFRVTIPMLGQVASLNASASAAILLAEVARQRHAKA